jgi:hypothetical protein
MDPECPQGWFSVHESRLGPHRLVRVHIAGKFRQGMKEQIGSRKPRRISGRLKNPALWIPENMGCSGSGSGIF